MSSQNRTGKGRLIAGEASMRLFLGASGYVSLSLFEADSPSRLSLLNLDSFRRSAFRSLSARKPFWRPCTVVCSTKMLPSAQKKLRKSRALVFCSTVQKSYRRCSSHRLKEFPAQEVSGETSVAVHPLDANSIHS